MVNIYIYLLLLLDADYWTNYNSDHENDIEYDELCDIPWYTGPAGMLYHWCPPCTSGPH